ncbi:MAG TPA: hypothetical protein VGF30_02455 [Bacteroidia bacterium]
MMNEKNGSSVTCIELEVKTRKPDPVKKELVEVLNVSAKLNKSDAGPQTGLREDWLTVTIEDGEKNDNPKITLNSHSKLTKADAGKVDQPA